VETITTHDSDSINFSKNRAVYDIIWKNMIQPDGLQMTIYLIRICMLDTYGYKQTLRICSTCCFSTATMVAQRCLNITSYVQRLSCSILERYAPCNYTVHLEGVQDSFYCFNPLTPNDNYSGRTAPPTSKRCILYIYSTNIRY
jgi:hypothetical protein